MIDKVRLMDKIDQKKPLSDEDYQAMSVLLCELRYSKERFNFFFIFAASAVALVLAAYFDFFH